MTAQEIANELERLRGLAFKFGYTADGRELMEGLASLIGTVLREAVNHRCNRAESWWEHDAQGIELCRVCDYCQEVKLRRIRPEILTGYTQADVAEPIEPG